jgi:hypothetical protein
MPRLFVIALNTVAFAVHQGEIALRHGMAAFGGFAVGEDRRALAIVVREKGSQIVLCLWPRFIGGALQIL